jgi:hypothetical protein
LMRAAQCRHLTIIRDGKAVGMVSHGQLLADPAGTSAEAPLGNHASKAGFASAVTEPAA